MTKAILGLIAIWAIALPLTACNNSNSLPNSEPENAPLSEPAEEDNGDGSTPGDS